MALLKALLLAAILTFVVSAAITGGHSTGGFLNIQAIEVGRHFVQWSWPLFVAAAGLAFGLLLIMK